MPNLKEIVLYPPLRHPYCTKKAVPSPHGYGTAQSIIHEKTLFRERVSTNSDKAVQRFLQTSSRGKNKYNYYPLFSLHYFLFEYKGTGKKEKLKIKSTKDDVFSMKKPKMCSSRKNECFKNKAMPPQIKYSFNHLPSSITTEKL